MEKYIKDIGFFHVKRVVFKKRNSSFQTLCHVCGDVAKHGKAGEAKDDNIARCTRFACWISKATDAFRIFNAYCTSTSKVVTRNYVNVTSYIHCLSCKHFFNTERIVPRNVTKVRNFKQ
jgi:hypothetical protein